MKTLINRKERTGKIESDKVLTIILHGLKYVGLYPPEDASAWYIIFSVLINVIFTVWYPITTLVDLFLSSSARNFFANCSTTLATTLTSIKVLNLFFKRKQLDRMYQLLGILDERVEISKDPEEQRHLQAAVRISRLIFTCFAVLFTFIASICFLPVLFSEERRIVYPAWFPFDWKDSDFNYYFVVVYQVVGVWILIYENLLNDTCPGLLLWLLRGHFRVLNARVSRLGFTLGKNSQDTYQELVKCVRDHKLILEYRDQFENAFGGILFIQFFVTELILCITAVYFYFIENKLELLYTATYFCAMVNETCLPCYCGNEVIYENEQFMNALYSCNWIEQDSKFKRALIIVMQKTQKSVEIFAAGIVKVSLSTLLTIFKTAYSLFTLMNQLR